jgi:hypothetical protein
MKADVQAKWQENLTSGNFTQGYRYLRSWDPDDAIWKYCCLGVLCEQSGLSTWVERTTESGDLVSDYLDSRMYLPPAVAEWAGIDPDCESEEGAQQRLGSLNDSGATFRTIANAIGTDPSL